MSLEPHQVRLELGGNISGPADSCYVSPCLHQPGFSGSLVAPREKGVGLLLLFKIAASQRSQRAPPCY